MNQASNNEVKTVAHLAGVLFLIAFAATLLLTVCNALTEGRIEALAKQTETEAMQAVLPDADTFQSYDGSVTDPIRTIYTGTHDGAVAGYCVSVAPLGYGGEIAMMVGISADGTVTGVEITSMSETPGLGAKASEPAFYEQYIGSAGPLSVIKSGTPKDNEVVAISGATITSKAVTEGVNAALEAVQAIGGGQQ